MTIAIIHSENRTDRWELLQRELQEQEISEYKMFPAVFMQKPKMGINKAHKNVISFAKESGLNEICVWEDDVHWVAKGAFEYFINKKPKEYDLYLSSVLNGRIEGDGSLHGTVTGFQAYMVHQNFYDRFLEADPNLDIDHAIMKANYKAENKAKIICCYPFATMEHNTFSDNTKRFHDLNRLYHDRKFFTGE